MTPRDRPRRLSLPEARRLSLAAQGFDTPRPAGRVDARHIRGVFRRLHLLQIDYVNVLVPAHYLVLFSRLGPYDTSILDRLVYREREFTEQWAREACIVPMETWPLLKHRKDVSDRRARAFATFMGKYRDYADRVIAEVHTRGPLVASDVTEPDGTIGRRGMWWGWTVAKTALESHFAFGRLAIADRRQPGAARVYDLVERVIPSGEHARDVIREEAQRELLRRAARAHGVGTASDLADYYRMPLREARPRLAELVASGELHVAEVETWQEPAYLHPAAVLPRRVDACALLAPFDPVVWHRARAKRLFGFDYLLEIWVPKAKRRWGYYVLPFLFGDRLAARVDVKADRAEGRLMVLAAFLEPGMRGDRVASALAGELRLLAGWLNLRSVRVQARGRFARELAGSVRGRG